VTQGKGPELLLYDPVKNRNEGKKTGSKMLIKKAERCTEGGKVVSVKRENGRKHLLRALNMRK